MAKITVHAAERRGTGPCFRTAVEKQNGINWPKNGPVAARPVNSYMAMSLRIAVLAMGVAFWASVAGAEDYRAPARVVVKPVFFVPKGEKGPTGRQMELIVRHLKWAQVRYKEMLGGRDTFALAEGRPEVCLAERELEFYRRAPGGGAGEYVGELLRQDKCNRYSCPYIYVAVIMNQHDGFPGGGARPLNGGFNTGGGIFIMSSYGLEEGICYQSTIQHELGHAFGLPHVDVYGYDMETNRSIMSYNPGHHTNGFEPSATPGELIAEDLRGLALNRRAFPRLRYDPRRDCPPGYKIAPIIGLGPMELEGQPRIVVTTSSGEADGSKVANIVQGFIGPNKEAEATTGGAAAATFDPQTMWRSEKRSDGWARVRVVFPSEVELSRVGIHSQHGGKHDGAEAVWIGVEKGAGVERVFEDRLGPADAVVSFAPRRGRSWEFRFKAGASGAVVIRGLQFFLGEEELFPSLVPDSWVVGK